MKQLLINYTKSIDNMLLIKSNKEQISQLSDFKPSHIPSWEHYFESYAYCLELIIQNGIGYNEFNPRAKAILFIYFQMTELFLKFNLEKNNIAIPFTHKLTELSEVYKRNDICLPNQYFEIEDKIKEIDIAIDGASFRYFADKNDNPYYSKRLEFDFSFLLKKYIELQSSNEITIKKLNIDIVFSKKNIGDLTFHMHECKNIHHVRSHFDYTSEFIIHLMLENKVSINKIYLPLFFLIRHSMELGLKTNIYEIRKISELMGVNDISQEHSLAKLFDIFFTFLQKITRNKLNIKTRSELEVFEIQYQKLNKTIDDFDNNSFYFRYPVNKLGDENKFNFSNNSIKEVVELYYFTDPFITFTVNVLQNEGLL